VVATALLALACTDPTPPSRAGTYRFDLGGEVFHWPADRLPVRFYAQPAGSLPSLVRRATEVWAGLFLYGEFEGELVRDSLGADVIVVWSDSVPPDIAPDTSHRYACTGVTSVPAVDAGGRYTGPIHIAMSVLSGYTAPEVAACMRRTAIHEVGHALGLFPHSPSPGDIMWGPSAGAALLVDLPTDQDRRTVEVLYHTPPTVRPAP
jgi:hypothetical protein